MTIKEIYAIVKEIEDHVEDTCCSVTMDPLDVKDLITKLRIIKGYLVNFFYPFPIIIYSLWYCKNSVLRI